MYLRQENLKQTTELQLKLEELQNEENACTLEVERVKKALYDLHVSQEMGAKIRYRVKWWEEGETDFFHNLEKSRGKEKAWNKILDKNGELVYGTAEVQKRQVEFYKDLFKSSCDTDEKALNDILSKIDRRLDEKSKEYLEKWYHQYWNPRCFKKTLEQQESWSRWYTNRILQIVLASSWDWSAGSL